MVFEINPSWHRSELAFWGVAITLGLLNGCSLRNFDSLTSGEPSGEGGSSEVSSGGASDKPSSKTGGTSSKTTPAAGGTTARTTTSTGGTTAQATTAAGGAPVSLCTFAAIAGQQLTPPSQGFEVDFGGFTTTAQTAGALTRSPSDTETCEGGWYLSCDGTVRTANWDGPSIDLLPFITIGHTYQYSAGVRLSPVSAPAAARALSLVLAKSCTDSAIATQYDKILTKAVFTKWLHLSAQFTVALPAGCSEFATLRAYIESDDTAAPFASIDVDDFKLLDITPAGT